MFALSSRIGAEIAYALTQNRALSNDMWSMSAQALTDASVDDAAEVGSEEITATIFSRGRA